MNQPYMMKGCDRFCVIYCEQKFSFIRSIGMFDGVKTETDKF